MSSKRIALGIDQGIANCGFAVVREGGGEEDYEVLISGTIKTLAKDGIPKRVKKIYDIITGLITEYNVELIGCEKLFFNPKQAGGRNKSASILYTNMATGLLNLCAGELEKPIFEYVPGTIKKQITGSGRATKEEVEEALYDLISTLIKFKTEHESDAVGIAITALRDPKTKQKLEELALGIVVAKPKKKKKETKTTKTRKKKGEIDNVKE